ncbi:major facilitator superfamily domain-containing protein [Xylariales sp. PMI_506]|nr:major facilitator superfamily domain-containing protein [Xylariales sp. PMI_506]
MADTKAWNTSNEDSSIVVEANHGGEQDQGQQESSAPKSKSEIKTEKSATTDNRPDDYQYPTGWKLASIFAGLFLAVLCLSLDRSILTTAIPKITDEFHSLDDVGWYGSAYLMISSCFQLTFGKVYAEFNQKWVFLGALLIFEVGSVVCASATSSIALIIGRALAGLGSSGVTAGALIILTHAVPLHNRPKFTAAIGAATGISQALAPTIGGALTDHASWRWCFWINLPLGAVTAITVLQLLHMPPNPNTDSGGSGFVYHIRQLLKKLDLLGITLIVPSFVCLFLALQWGGSLYSWSNWRVILCLCLFGVAFIAWVYVQHRLGDRATLPLRLVKMRSMACAMWLSTCTFGSLFVVIYYVPIWFQGIQDTDATQSGVNMLAFSVPMSFTAAISGAMISKVGYYVPNMIATTVLQSAATALVSRFGLNTSKAYWAGTLVFLGIGVGIGFQAPIMVPQSILQKPDVPLGISALALTQSLSAAIFLAVGENILEQKLIAQLEENAPSVDPSVIVNLGTAKLKTTLSGLYSSMAVQEVLASYANALQQVFIIPLALACIGIFGSAFVEWVNIRKNVPKEKNDAGQSEEKNQVVQEGAE